MFHRVLELTGIIVPKLEKGNFWENFPLTSIEGVAVQVKVKQLYFVKKLGNDDREGGESREENKIERGEEREGKER